MLDSLPLLGAIPLDPATAVSGDKGQPVVASKPESAVAAAFNCMAEQVAAILITAGKSLDMQMPESQEELGTTKGDLFSDERED